MDRLHGNTFEGNPDVLLRPGLVANRATKRVEILTEATGLKAGEIVEFIVIDQSCGRGYEALLWSFAKPSDVHEALTFIGMDQGEAFHPNAFRFWPKGERVHAHLLAPQEEKEAPSEALPLESYLQDKKTGQRLETKGFVFTGSFRSPTNGAYAADVIEPKSIITTFNLRNTVLDVPVRAPEREVYGTRLVHPEHVLQAHQLVTLILQPEFTDGTTRVRDLTLRVRSDTDAPVALYQKDRELSSGAWVDVLASFNRLTSEGKEPHVQLHFDEALTLADAARIAPLIKTIDTDAGIRVGPPGEGQLFYEAFCPRPEMRERESRFSHPWELQYEETAEGKGKGILELWGFVDEDDETTATPLTAQRWPVASRAALKEAIEKENARRDADPDAFPVPQALFVHAPPTARFGNLVQFIDSVLPDPATVYVFVD